MKKEENKCWFCGRTAKELWEVFDKELVGFHDDYPKEHPMLIKIDEYEDDYGFPVHICLMCDTLFYWKTREYMNDGAKEEFIDEIIEKIVEKLST